MTIINQTEPSTEYLRNGRNLDVQRRHDRGDVDTSMDNMREILRRSEICAAAEV
jgi:hypothetical protein